MIAFQPIELDKIEEYSKYYDDKSALGCESNFVSGYLWSKEYKLCVALLDDTIIKAYFRDERNVWGYCMPHGKNVRGAIEAIFADAAERGQKPVIAYMTKEEREQLEELYPGRFKYVREPENQEYIYNSSDLDNLPGGVTQVALVAYKSGSNGLAIALADIPEGDYFSGSTNCSALNTAMPITGAIWGMPSKYDWQNMIDAYSYIGGWTAFKAAAKLADHEYWTSTDEMPNTYNVLGTDGDMTMTADGSSATKYSRAVLSW